MAKHKVYKVGVYVRLSKEDSRVGESISIENQKLMLTKYVEEKGWELREIYQDDGFSGTNQNRPAFQRMIADIKQGYINTILIKDLSRLGRNYLEVGNLAEVFLPEHGCELISLNEKIDDMMVFRNWFNEQHSKSTSVKVRAAKRVSAQNGKYLGAYAPYGYKKDPDNRRRLVVDENTAPVVRSIFEMRMGGASYRAIVTRLNEDEIVSPREYYYQQQDRKNPMPTRRLWGTSTIKDLMKNEVYIGNLISGKHGSVSYKNQKLIRKDKEEWIRADNTHEPIIPLEIWEKVQSLAEEKRRFCRRNDGEANLFTGLLYCADCGFRLRGQVERRLRKDGSEYKNVNYMCNTFASCGKKTCTAHGVSENTLVDLVLEHIRGCVKWLKYDKQRIFEAVLELQQNDIVSYGIIYKNELDSQEKQVEKIDLLIESLYTDKLNGLIPDSLFKRQMQKYEQERIERTKKIKDLNKRINSIKPIANNTTKWIQLIEKYADIKTLDHETLLLLIDRIIINEARYVDKKRVCDIKIIYNYVGDMDRLALPLDKADEAVVI